GVAQVWPRAWLVDGVTDPQAVARRMSRWLAKTPVVGSRRCGIARGATADGEPVVAAIAVDAVADLVPLRRRTRVGEWLTIEAVMQAPADGAKVVLLGPRGRPRRALTSLSSGRVRARLNLDQPGRWLVQVTATLDGGPRPVL
ncbi:MAG: CAP domain-containing protein, partial [Deltaproteobacteria bacterium]|nr:CAP domain-containing protein [Deltaproteobacteria bacterium]